MNQPKSESVLIHIAQWEHQCCGTPIGVGDVVDLTVSPSDVPDAWGKLFGEPVALIASHHCPPDDSWHVRVRVDRLWVARAQRTSSEQDPRTLVVVPGTAEIAPRSRMAVWDERPSTSCARPEGWILRCTILRTLLAIPGYVYGGDMTAAQYLDGLEQFESQDVSSYRDRS